MKTKIFYIISALIIVYALWILDDWGILFKEPTTDFGYIIKIFLPILSLSSATIIYGIGCLLKDNDSKK